MTYCSCRCHHRLFKSKPSYFHHLAGDRVAAVHEEASPIPRRRSQRRWQTPQRQRRRRRPSRGGRNECRRERKGPTRSREPILRRQMRSRIGRKSNPAGKRQPGGASPPQNRPRSGDAKQIIPLTGDVKAFGHAYVISCMIVLMSPLRSKFYLFPHQQSNYNSFLSSYQLFFYQEYQKWTNIWQVKRYQI